MATGRRHRFTLRFTVFARWLSGYGAIRWNQAFSDKAITVSKELGYDNTCIWVLTDNGEITNHKELYALPKGMGISCCMEDYVTANIKTLKSRFIATVEGGAIDELCEQNGYEEIGRTNSLVIYKMY